MNNSQNTQEIYFKNIEKVNILLKEQSQSIIIYNVMMV